MAKRFKAIKVGARCRVTVKYDREWCEYQVKAWVGTKVSGTYHTPDSDDARGSQKAMARELRDRRGAQCSG